jgi:hypothetical protein
MRLNTHLPNPKTPTIADVVWKIAVIALLVQIASATFLVKSFSTPNASVVIARNIASAAEFWGGNPERLWGRYAHGKRLRMFNLPGEPLLLAGAFRVLPAPALRYLHVPLTTLLITCATGVAGRIGGRVLAWVTGLVAIFHPFMVLHGPVWDDVVAASALTWAAIYLAWPVKRLREWNWATVVLLGLGAAAALFRAEAQAVLGVLGLAAMVLPKLRPIRVRGLAIVVGIAVALVGWGLRNKVVSGQFFTGSTHDGITLWESVYPSASDSIRRRGGAEWLDLERMDFDYDKTRDMSEFEANRYFTHRAVAYIFSHPYALTKLAGLKLVVDALGVDFTRPLDSTRNVVGIVCNAVLIALALFSVGRHWTAALSEEERFFIGTVMIITLSIDFGLFLVGPVGLRYGMTISPLLWIGAAMTLIHWVCSYNGPAETDIVGSAAGVERVGSRKGLLRQRRCGGCRDSTR